MLIKTEHIKHSKEEMFKSGNTPTLKSYTSIGLSERRWRWDWCYATPGLSKWICDNIYSYANDTHIDTALKYITRSI